MAYCSLRHEVLRLDVNHDQGQHDLLAGLDTVTAVTRAEGTCLHGPSPGQAGLHGQIPGVVLDPCQPNGTPPVPQ